MQAGRLNREQFYAAMAALDEAGLRKALWSLYWRGSASVRERVLATVAPSAAPAPATGGGDRVEATELLNEVNEFAALARRGSYLAGDRSVSPKQRTRWRFTFQRLAKAATEALAGRDADSASAAMATLIDLACEVKSVDYFRSEDAVEAARFVVSDAAAAIWSATRREHGHAAFCERAAEQLLRWESRYGWTRRGEGWVSRQETTLAEVVAGMLRTPDAWDAFAEQYLRALDAIAGRGSGAGSTRSRKDRSERLREWHSLLRQHLADSEDADVLDRLARHPALVEP